MILRDFECKECDIIFEKICESKIRKYVCPKCGTPAPKIMTVGRVYMGNQDVDWVKDVREVVDKEGGRECQEFLKNPTRSNHKNWMKAKKLRVYEPGEKHKKDINLSKVRKEVTEKAMYRYNQGRR